MHATLQNIVEHLSAEERAALPSSFVDAIDRALADSDRALETLQSSAEHELHGTVEELEKSLTWLGAVLDLTHDGIIFANHQGHPDIFNPVALQQLELDNNQLTSMDYPALARHLKKVVRNASSALHEIRHEIGDGSGASRTMLEMHSDQVIELHSRPFIVDDKLLGRVWTLRDITELKLSEREARYNAGHDRLTGLPNRTRLYDRLEQSLSAAKRSASKVGILFMDLDGFKPVNDHYGHDIGDLLLVEVAGRLSACLREMDTVARFGGDEFVILLHEIDDAHSAAEVAQRVINCFNTPFDVRQLTLNINTSIGIALYPDNADTPESLLKRADMAMYHAKSRSQGFFEFYSERLSDAQRLQLGEADDIQQVLQSDGPHLHTQPRRDSQGQQTSSQIDWTWPDSHHSLFKPSTEHSPQSSEFNRHFHHWLFDQVAQHCARNAIYILPLHPQCVFDTAFQDTLEAHQSLCDLVHLQIPEAVFAAHTDTACALLKQWQNWGWHIEISQFASGSAPLNYLLNWSPDSVAIDASLLNPVTRDDQAGQRLQQLIGGLLSHVPAVTALDVSSQEEAEMLFRFGITHIQGPFLGEAASLT